MMCTQLYNRLTVQCTSHMPIFKVCHIYIYRTAYSSSSSSLTNSFPVSQEELLGPEGPDSPEVEKIDFAPFSCRLIPKRPTCA